MLEKVVEGDGGEDQPCPIQQGGGVEHQGQREEDGRVPGILTRDKHTNFSMISPRFKG